MDTGDFSFSFKCDWCSFATKDILEIKDHVNSHKQKTESSENMQQSGTGSGETETTECKSLTLLENVKIPKTENGEQEISLEVESKQQQNSGKTSKSDSSDSEMDNGSEDNDDDDEEEEEEEEEEDDDEEEEEERDSSEDESSDQSEKDDNKNPSIAETGGCATVERDVKSSGDLTGQGNQALTEETDGSVCNSAGGSEELQKKARRKPPIPKKAIKESEEMTNEEWELEGDMKDSGAVDSPSFDEDYDPGRRVDSSSTRQHPVITRSRDEQIIIQLFTEGQSVDTEANNSSKVQENQSKAKYLSKQKYECKTCHLSFKYKYRLTQHQKGHRTGKGSVVSKSKIQQQATKKQNIPSDRYKCSECEFSCKFKYRLKEHKAAQHKVEKPPAGDRPKKTYVCEICKYVAINRTKLLRHVRKHTGEKPFSCEECGMRFSEKGNLEKHKGRHTTETNFLCEECGKAFRRDINLRMHRRIHKTENLYECEHCDYTCVRKDMLESHRARKHIKMKSLLCDHCGKGFYSKQELESHRRNKHSQRITPYMCPICPGAFITEYKMKAHLKTHPEYKPFKCDYCGILFRKSASLVYHRRVHTGEKPLQCELCNYVTSTPSNMYKHRKREHGIRGNPNKKVVRKRGRFTSQGAVGTTTTDMKLVLLDIPPRLAGMSQPITSTSTVTPLPPAESEQHMYDYHYSQPSMQLHSHSHSHHHQPSPTQLQPHPQPHAHQQGQPPPPVTVTQPQQTQQQQHQDHLQHVAPLPPTTQDVINNYAVPPVHQVHQLLFHHQ